MRPSILVPLTLLGALMTGDCLMSQIAPRAEQIQELLQGPADTPVVMVNLLRFKKEAAHSDLDRESSSGRRVH